MEGWLHPHDQVRRRHFFWFWQLSGLEIGHTWTCSIFEPDGNESKPIVVSLLGTVSLGVLLKPPTFQESRVANQYFGHRGVLKTPPCARNSQFGGKAPVKDPRRCFQFIGKRVLWTIAPVLNVHPGICRIFIFFYFPEVQTLFWFFAIWQRNLKQLHPIMFWKLYFFAFALFFFPFSPSMAIWKSMSAWLPCPNCSFLFFFPRNLAIWAGPPVLNSTSA